MRLGPQMRMILKTLREWFIQLPEERTFRIWRGMDVKEIARAIYGDEAFYGRGRLLDGSIASSMYRSLKRLREHGLIVRDPWGRYWPREFLKADIVSSWILWLLRRRMELLKDLGKLEEKIKTYKELHRHLSQRPQN